MSSSSASPPPAPAESNDNEVRVVSYNILFSVVCDAAHEFNVRRFKADSSTGEILNIDKKALPHVVYTSRDEVEA